MKNESGHETHILSAERQTDNPFLNMYHLTFKDRAGKDGNYYFCTRNDDADLKIRTHDRKPDGICIYAVTKEPSPRLVLVHEYRFPIDDYIFSLPAGLSDPGETPGEAAARVRTSPAALSSGRYRGLRRERTMRVPNLLKFIWQIKKKSGGSFRKSGLR